MMACAFTTLALAAARTSGGLNVCQRLLDDRLAVGDGGARRIEVGLRLIHFGLKRRGIDLRDQLSLGDLGVEVCEQRQDVARHLRAHLDGDDRVGIAGRRDGHVDVAVSDG